MAYTRLGSVIILKPGVIISKIPTGVDTIIRQIGPCDGPYRLFKYQTLWRGKKLPIVGLPTCYKLKETQTLHRQNGLRYIVDWSKTYFNPRYAEERKLMSTIFKGKSLLVLFAGVGPIACTLSKNYKNITCVQWNKAASDLAVVNSRLNKLDNIKIVCQDVYKYVTQLKFLEYQDCITFSPTCDSQIIKKLSKKVNRLIHYQLLEDCQIQNHSLKYSKYGKIKYRRAKQYCKNSAIYQFIINFKKL